MDRFRKKIDKIDEQLVKLLDERMGLAFELGKLKKSDGRDVFDANREEEVFNKLQDLPKQTIRDDEIKELYEQIIRISRLHGERGMG
ncbi:MAG: chorismate mutase [Candidatus Marinimicrobia bacterium]|nr:chorismate mutase [Candidatus Neomarinimicrobiota bacterium]